MARVIQVICILAGMALLGAAVWSRIWDLGRLPGVNGDEAWYGVQAERMVRGECVPTRTPTGNAINPFFMAPQVLLHLFVDPSFAALRLPAMVSGLLALAVNFALCRRAFGARMANLTTLIHAVLPINIAYSRFAWDASQSLLFTLPIVYAAVLANQEPARRARWTMFGVFALAAAILAHPTNVFVAPFFAVVCGTAWRDRLATWWKSPALRRVGLPLLAVALLTAAWPVLPRAAANLASVDNYTAFARRFGDLFTGATVYEYISGSFASSFGTSRALLPAQIGLEWLSISITGLAAFALWNSIRRGRSSLDRRLVAGWAMCVASFFAIAGPNAIAPHFERYAICLVAPTVLLLGRAFHWWMRPTTRLAAATAPLLLVLGGCILATFRSHYFDELNQRSGNSHLTFRTAAVEPKQQAIEHIARERSTGVPVVVETSEWWLYWPLRYLTYGQHDITVELRGAADPLLVHAEADPRGEAWIVEFAESDAGWQLERAFAGLGSPNVEKRLICDGGGRRLLLLWRLPAR